MMYSLLKMKKICNTVIVQQYSYGGISVYGRAEKNRRRKFLRFLFPHHTLYILFFVGIGTNSSFNCIPNPCASFFTILRLGFLVPFIICFILLCQFFFCLWCLLRFFYKSIGQYCLLARLIASSISYIFVSLQSFSFCPPSLIVRK